MIPCLHYRAPSDHSNRILLVMLPGVGIEAAEFEGRGLLAALHSAGGPIDVIAARPALDLYYDGTVVAEIEKAVIRPAVAAGYTRLWFLGISLGGTGALLYTSSGRTPIEGLILLAPFIGTPGTIAGVIKTGGLAAWSAERSVATAIERKVLLWLKDFAAEPRQPALYLGYGRNDRFAPGYNMLSQNLPKDHVVTLDGGHDWDTWVRLWTRLLALEPFSHANGGQN